MPENNYDDVPESLESQRYRIWEKLDSLSTADLIVISDFIDAVDCPVDEEVKSDSWLVDSGWAKAFLVRLRAHHALAPEPLSRTQFETAFEWACRISGWNVSSATSSTQRFYDTIINRSEDSPIKISLKATSAKNLSKRRVHISKLTEAAWIQDARVKVDRKKNLVNLFDDYREITDCIIILRGFVGDGGGSIRYELVEIPTSLFAPVADVTLEGAQSSSIPVPEFSDDPDLKIRLDRSDAKVTIASIKLSSCIVHASWHLKKIRPAF